MCLGGDVAAGGASRARRAASPPLFSRLKPFWQCGGVACTEVAENGTRALLDVVDGQFQSIYIYPDWLITHFHYGRPPGATRLHELAARGQRSADVRRRYSRASHRTWSAGSPGGRRRQPSRKTTAAGDDPSSHVTSVKLNVRQSAASCVSVVCTLVYVLRSSSRSRPVSELDDGLKDRFLAGRLYAHI